MGWDEKDEELLLQRLKAQRSDKSEADLSPFQNITGAVSISDEPDTLFYTEFTRTDAKAFYEIYSNYKKYARENPFMAPLNLKENLKLQCESMSKRGVCPIEILLFAARLIERELYDSSILRKSIQKVVGLYIVDNLESVRYIICGWEWPVLLSVVIEACGERKDDRLIRLVMGHARELIGKCANAQNHIIVDALVNMLEATQDTEYIPFFGDVFGCKNACENDAQKYLLDKLQTRGFIQENREEIVSQICGRTIPNAFRTCLNHTLKGGGSIKRNIILNSDLSGEEKLNYINTEHLCTDTLKEFESCRDVSLFVPICKRVMDDFDNIPPYLRERGVLLLGTKGKSCSESVCSFLRQIENVPNTKAAVSFSLYERGEADVSEVLKVISQAGLWEKPSYAIGFYLRNVRSKEVSTEFISYISSVLQHADAMQASALLVGLYNICLAYNAPHNALSDKSQSDRIVREVFAVINLAVKQQQSESAYLAILQLLKLLAATNTERRPEILEVLDDIKTEAVKYKSVKLEYESLVKKVDIGAPPK